MNNYEYWFSLNSNFVIEKSTIKGLGYSWTYVAKKSGYTLICVTPIDNTSYPIESISVQGSESYTLRSSVNIPNGLALTCILLWVKN